MVHEVQFGYAWVIVSFYFSRVPQVIMKNVTHHMLLVKRTSKVLKARLSFQTNYNLSMQYQYMLLSGVAIPPLRWCCVDCVIHHERDMHEEQKYMCVARASNSKRDCNA